MACVRLTIVILLAVLVFSGCAVRRSSQSRAEPVAYVEKIVQTTAVDTVDRCSDSLAFDMSGSNRILKSCVTTIHLDHSIDFIPMEKRTTYKKELNHWGVGSIVLTALGLSTITISAFASDENEIGTSSLLVQLALLTTAVIVRENVEFSYSPKVDKCFDNPDAGCQIDTSISQDFGMPIQNRIRKDSIIAERILAGANVPVQVLLAGMRLNLVTDSVGVLPLSSVDISRLHFEKFMQSDGSLIIPLRLSYNDELFYEGKIRMVASPNVYDKWFERSFDAMSADQPLKLQRCQRDPMADAATVLGCYYKH